MHIQFAKTKKVPGIYNCLFLMLALAVIIMFYSAGAHANTATATTCAKQFSGSTSTPGENIVNAVFNAINQVLGRIGKTMYTGIVGNPSFTLVVNVCFSLYIATYGLMVFLGMASTRAGEVISRLIKLSIVYILIGFSGATGWVYFDRYFSALFLGGMDELIYDFGLAAGVPILPPATVTGLGINITPQLNATAVSALFGAMDIVYQPFYLFAILGMALLNPVCAMMALAMVFAFWDFTMMILGALVTYIRAWVGLTFLFGIAPLFIIFLLFERTRSLFYGWVSQCIGFALAPVLLFAFLSFYTMLLTSTLNGMFNNVDFCWAKAGSIPGTTSDFAWYRPAKYVADTSGSGNKSWVLQPGAWTDPSGNPIKPPISIVSVLLFVLVANLGKNFTKHIAELASSLAGSAGGGITSGEEVQSKIGNMMGGTGSSMSNAFKRMTSKPTSIPRKGGAGGGIGRDPGMSPGPGGGNSQDPLGGPNRDGSIS